MKIVVLFLMVVSFLFSGVDINNATQKEFSTLSGVGTKKADEIIAYRLKNGCFKSIDDLANVKGIGEKTITKNKDNLILGRCKN